MKFSSRPPGKISIRGGKSWPLYYKRPTSKKLSDDLIFILKLRPGRCLYDEEVADVLLIKSKYILFKKEAVVKCHLSNPEKLIIALATNCTQYQQHIRIGAESTPT